MSETQRQTYCIKAGDVLLNRTSETIRQLGCGCVAVKPCDAVYSGFAKRLRPKEPDTIDSFYAAGFFRSQFYRSEMERVATVYTTRLSLNCAQLKRVRMYLPSRQLQQEIGAVLAAIFDAKERCRDTELQRLLETIQTLFIEYTITKSIVLEKGGEG